MSYLLQSYKGISLSQYILLVLAGYSSMILLPAFNADDIIQSQAISSDYDTFLSQGRWGYYIIYGVLAEANPLGPWAMIAGLSILVFAFWLAAEDFKFISSASQSLFILISTISLYYSSVLSFDSTRIAYPAAILLAVIGVKLAWRRRYFVALVPFSIAPALYPSSIQVALTLFFALAMFDVIFSRKYLRIRDVAMVVLCLIVAMIFYVISTKLASFATGITLSERSDIDPIAAISNYERIIRLFLGHSLPSGYQMPYYNDGLILISRILMIVSLIVVLVQAKLINLPVSILLFLGLICSPFALAFATPLDQFSPRSLIAFSLVHAVLATLSIEYFNFRKWGWMSASITILSCLFVVVNAVQINASSFDEHLSSRNDVLATSRIISSIDSVLINSDIPMNGPIPIAVKFSDPYSTAPSGEPGTARSAPWSKEWIFRHVDPRFVPVLASEVFFEDAPDVVYPDPRSIYVKDGVVVVVIN